MRLASNYVGDEWERDKYHSIVTVFLAICYTRTN